MKRVLGWTAGLVLPAAVVLLLSGASVSREQQDLLWHDRNLGKAFYENPTTQKETVAEFKKARADDFPEDAAHREYREEYNTRPALRLLRPLAAADGGGR
jgi:hypothetical protein